MTGLRRVGDRSATRGLQTARVVADELRTRPGIHIGSEAERAARKYGRVWVPMRSRNGARTLPYEHFQAETVSPNAGASSASPARKQAVRRVWR